jgi:glycosyltransferase involved in cell wall biosynthesis
MLLGIEASHANRLKRTGVEEYCFQIIEHLKKVIPADTRVVLYSEKKLLFPLAELPDNWESKVIAWTAKKGWSQFALSKYFLKNSPDVFFAPGQLVPFICPKNTVTMVHDSAFKVFPSAYRFFGRQYLKVMNRLILKKSKIIITPSEFSKNELIRIYNYPRAENIKVVHHGHDEQNYHWREFGESEKQQLLKKYNITKPFYIFAGRLEEKKNMANIVRAFDKIKNKIDTQLFLAGSFGQGSKKIIETIKTSPNNKDIILPGWVNEEDLPLLFNLALALLFPTKYEGFGLPLLNAMASGCPTVASLGHSLEEIGGDSSVYVDARSPEQIAEAVIKLFVDNEFRAKMIEKGLERSKIFTWDKAARETWQILREAGK